MAPFSMMDFLKSQLITGLPVIKKDLSGQIVIVTGANVGLGLETAKHLATMNPARLIIACRNLDKGEAAVLDIKATPGSTQAVEVWKLDLCSFQSVKEFQKRIYSDLERLDILIENAGIATNKWDMTQDGYEMTLQTNVLSTTLLALLSLPKMRETVRKFATRPRLVIVGSEVHFWAQFPEQSEAKAIAALNDKAKFVPGDRYFVSKLLDLFVTREIVEHLKVSGHPEDKSIDVNCANPGLCHSELSRHDDGWRLYLMKLMLARSTEYVKTK